MRIIIIQAILLLGLIGAFFAQPVTTFASSCTNSGTTHGQNNGSKNQQLYGIAESGGDCDESGVTSSLATATAILSYIAGIIAIIMILVSGFKYATSGGDSNRVGSAKTTLIYALVGIAIAAITQFLVHYVYNQSTVATTTPCSVVRPNIPQSDPSCQTSSNV